jgi:hypothetical protein
MKYWHKIIDLAKTGVRDPERLCEAMRWAFQSKTEKEKRALIELART